MQGKTINGFELKSQLGVGGMAEVWYAENRIGKKAAVKILLPKLCQDENVVSRFFTEAKVMVDLNHPNIRQVYDYGELDGRPAIIMEYLEGEDLKARMKRGQRFTDEELKKWWNQLVSALNYTHQKGIVHRDIKPGNIFVDREGNIKLLDFGIAKVRESISKTQTGQKLGTLMYMSPEQVKDSKHIDYGTDVYSLAVTFVHLLTGKKPYDSDTSSDFEISEQIVYKPLDLSEVPLDWQSFLELYLKKAPEKRPALRCFEIGDGTTCGNTIEEDDEKTMMDVATPGSKKGKVESQLISQAKYKSKKKRKKGVLITIVGVAAVVVTAVIIIVNLKQREMKLYPATKDGKWGFIDKVGNFVINPQFDNAWPYSEGLAVIEIGNKYGVIDDKGNIVVSPQYDYVDSYSEGLATVQVDFKYGFIDKKGVIVINPQYDDVDSYSEGLARVRVDGKYGFIDKNGVIVIKPQYDYADSFSDRLAMVVVEDRHGFINHIGEMVISPRYEMATSFSEGLAAVEYQGKYRYIDKKGNTVIDRPYESVNTFSEGLACVMIDDKWGYINKNGDIVISPTYYNVEPFSEGLAAVYLPIEQSDGEIEYKGGYIDKTGKMVIPPRFDYTNPFDGGLAGVVFEYWGDPGLGDDGVKFKYGYIDKNGKVIFENIPDREDNSFLSCQTIEDFKGYIAAYGRMSKYYYDVMLRIEQYESDSIQQAQQESEKKAQAEQEDQSAGNKKRDANNKLEKSITPKQEEKMKQGGNQASWKEGKDVSKATPNIDQKKEQKTQSEVETSTVDESSLMPLPDSYSNVPICTYYFQKDSYDITARSKLNKEADAVIKDMIGKYIVKGFRVVAWTSPDSDSVLVENYTQATVKQIKKVLGHLGLNVSKYKFEIIGCGPDWHKFIVLVECSSLKDKDAILASINSSSNKEESIELMCAIYPQLERDVLPQLRRAEIYVY